MNERPLALYLHVPFCARKCAYCDFASYPGREDDWKRYFDALMTEIRLWSKKTDFGMLNCDYRVKSVFVGGGTPTLVDAEDIAEALDACRRLAPFDDDVEITVEGNPGTLTPEKLAVYRGAGVNRLSLGAQSFDDALLRDLGRIHTAAQIGEAAAMAREAGFENLNLDLMYALPGQTMEQWMETLEAAVALSPRHVSAYSLIVEPGTPMAERVRRGAAVLPDEDAAIAMQRAATKRLQKSDYGRYEISNYARPGSQCRHNLTYWHRGDYLGLGCAAHSLMRGRRFSNPASLDEYLSGTRGVGMTELSREDAMDETVMLATRTLRGLDLARWREEFGTDFVKTRSKIIDRLASAGLIMIEGGRLRLTEAGLEVHNAVVLELLSEGERVK